MLHTAWAWFNGTLQAYPELGVFLALAMGFGIGPRKIGGFALGSVTATLLAAILIGQLGIRVEGPIKAAFFLLFLFAVGYGVGPQFFRGISKEGPKQIVFSLIVLALCLLIPIACAWIAGLNIGYAAGLYAGSQTISASIGVASDQLERLGLTAAEAKAQADAIPIGYAVTYIFGTIGSAVLLAQLGPKLIGVDLPAACAEYERSLGGGIAGFEPGVFSAYRSVETRAYSIESGCGLTGRPVRELFPDLRIFVERVRRGDRLIDADGDTVLFPGDTAAISGPRPVLVEHVHSVVREVSDQGLLDFPATMVDVFVTNKAINGKTLRDLADLPFARGVYLRRISRQLVDMPILPGTEVLRGDILTIGGSTRHIEAAVAGLGTRIDQFKRPI